MHQPLGRTENEYSIYGSEVKSKRAIISSSPGGVGQQLSVFAPGQRRLWSCFGPTFNQHPAVSRCQNSFHWVVFKCWSTGWERTNTKDYSSKHDAYAMDCILYLDSTSTFSHNMKMNNIQYTGGDMLHW